MAILSSLLSNPITAGLIIIGLMFVILKISGAWKLIIEDFEKEKENKFKEEIKRHMDRLTEKEK